jgi:acetyl esterase/lipase
VRKTVPVLLIILGLCAPVLAEAQDVVRLWEGRDKPYYRENTLEEREEQMWGTRCATNVIDPTLTIYEAEGGNAGVGVVIIPGGNYAVVAVHHEGHDVAKVLARQGITAAVLKYRLPDPRSSDQPWMVPLADARRALTLLRERSVRYGINRSRVGVLGFSAGSHLATVASLWRSENADENPAFSGLIYGVTTLSTENLKWLEERLYFRRLTPEELATQRLLDLVDKDTPPAFLVHAYDDDTCKVEESTRYAQRLSEQHVPVEMHLFPRGGHGFGVGRKADGTDQWVPLFVAWVKRQPSGAAPGSARGR